MVDKVVSYRIGNVQTEKDNDKLASVFFDYPPPLEMLGWGNYVNLALIVSACTSPINEPLCFLN